MRLDSAFLFDMIWLRFGFSWFQMRVMKMITDANMIVVMMFKLFPISFCWCKNFYEYLNFGVGSEVLQETQMNRFRSGYRVHTRAFLFFDLDPFLPGHVWWIVWSLGLRPMLSIQNSLIIIHTPLSYSHPSLHEFHYSFY